MDRPNEHIANVYQDSLNAALERWQRDQESSHSHASVDSLIGELQRFGFGFILKCKKEVLFNSGPQSKAISEEDAIKFGTQEAEYLVFEIPTLNQEVNWSKRLFMEVAGAQSGSKIPTHLTLRNDMVGTFARFIPTEISSIELK